MKWEEQSNKLTEEINLKYSKELDHYEAIKTGKMRVSQLDGILIDNEIIEILFFEFNKIFSVFSEEKVLRFKPELSLMLQFILFRLSLFPLGTTYGYQSQNLKLKLPKENRYRTMILISFFLLQSILPYLYAKLSKLIQPYALLPEGDPKKLLWKRFSKIEDVMKLLKFVNFIVFLYEGKYVSLVHRMLLCRLETSSNSERSISFDYLNRQLLWNAFSDFMKFIMPKIDLKIITNYFRFSGHQITDTSCEICGDVVMTPYVDSDERCHHWFCYWCIYQKLQDDQGYTCSRCNYYITNVKHAKIA